jgi:opacity protein-like surface antigen
LQPFLSTFRASTINIIFQKGYSMPLISRIPAITAVAMMLAIPGHGFASSGSPHYAGAYYLAIGAGLAEPRSGKGEITDGTNTFAYELNGSFVGAIEAGYRINDFRVGLEYSYRRVEQKITLDVGLLQTERTYEDGLHTGMLNVYYDIDTGIPFTPYIGAGIGASLVDNSSSSTDSSALSMQGIVGASYAVTNSLELFADYRYLHTGFKRDADVASALNVAQDIDYHNAIAGLRVSF